MKAQLEKPVLDCPDPRSLAAFYAGLLAMEVLEDGQDWVVLGRRPGMREIAFQRADPLDAAPVAGSGPSPRPPRHPGGRCGRR